MFAWFVEFQVIAEVASFVSNPVLKMSSSIKISNFFSTLTDLLRGKSPNFTKNDKYVANINNYYKHKLWQIWKYFLGLFRVS